MMAAAAPSWRLFAPLAAAAALLCLVALRPTARSTELADVRAPPRVLPKKGSCPRDTPCLPFQCCRHLPSPPHCPSAPPALLPLLLPLFRRRLGGL